MCGRRHRLGHCDGEEIDTPGSAGLKNAYCAVRPALPLLYSYMVKGTAVNKSAWSCRRNGACGRAPAVSQAWPRKLARVWCNHTIWPAADQVNRQQAVSRAPVSSANVESERDHGHRLDAGRLRRRGYCRASKYWSGRT